MKNEYNIEEIKKALTKAIDSYYIEGSYGNLEVCDIWEYFKKKLRKERKGRK